MAYSRFKPEPELISNILEGKEDFETAEIRMELSANGKNSSTKAVNRMLLDLADEGYVEPVKYQSSDNHQWSSNDYSQEELEEDIGEYSSTDMSPAIFYGEIDSDEY